MYCNRCGGDDHWAAQCEAVRIDRIKVEPQSAEKIHADLLIPVDEVSEAQRRLLDYCPACGTNLAAKRKARERKKRYMREYRKR